MKQAVAIPKKIQAECQVCGHWFSQKRESGITVCDSCYEENVKKDIGYNRLLEAILNA